MVVEKVVCKLPKIFFFHNTITAHMSVQEEGFLSSDPVAQLSENSTEKIADELISGKIDSVDDEIPPAPEYLSLTVILKENSSVILKYLSRTAINLILPFINGMMLGFGEILAHEIGFRFNWSGSKVCCHFFPIEMLYSLLTFFLLGSSTTTKISVKKTTIKICGQINKNMRTNKYKYIWL